MIYAGVHLIVVVVSATTVAALLKSTWQSRSPHVAVLLWQCSLAAIGLSGVGVLLSVGFAERRDAVAMATSLLVHPTARLNRPQWVAVLAGLILAAWLAATLAAVLWHGWRRRAQVRSLLSIVGNRDTTANGVYVLEHPALAAYCLPGRQSRVVISTGTIAALAATELRSVLAHERAHARQRHDLALVPVLIMCRILRRTRLAEAIRAQVGLLVEMCADEAASREFGRDTLSNALRRFGAMHAAPVPDGTLGATDSVLSRCERLDHPPAPLPAAVVATVVAGALLLLSVPLGLFVFPV